MHCPKWSIVVMCASVLLSSCAQQQRGGVRLRRDSASSRGVNSGGDVLYVNGQAITVEDILDPVLSRLRKAEEFSSADVFGEYVVAKIRDELLSQVQDLLVFQDAAKSLSEQHHQVLDTYVDQEIKARVNSEFAGRQTRYEAYLASLGMSMDDARRRVRRQLVIYKHLQDKIVPRISHPTRQQLLEMYRQNATAYTSEASRELFLIDIPKQDDPEAAFLQARSAMAAIQGGTAFELVAKQYSMGIKAQQGGAWGSIQSSLGGRYGPISESFRSLGSGQVSDIIDAEDAYFIVSVGAVVEAKTRPFEMVQGELIAHHRDGQFSTLRAEMLGALVSAAVIEPNEDAFMRAVVDRAFEHLSAGN